MARARDANRAAELFEAVTGPDPSIPANDVRQAARQPITHDFYSAPELIVCDELAESGYLVSTSEYNDFKIANLRRDCHWRRYEDLSIDDRVLVFKYWKENRCLRRQRVVMIGLIMVCLAVITALAVLYIPSPPQSPGRSRRWAAHDTIGGPYMGAAEIKAKDLALELKEVVEGSVVTHDGCISPCDVNICQRPIGDRLCVGTTKRHVSGHFARLVAILPKQRARCQSTDLVVVDNGNIYLDSCLSNSVTEDEHCATLTDCRERTLTEFAAWHNTELRCNVSIGSRSVDSVGNITLCVDHSIVGEALAKIHRTANEICLRLLETAIKAVKPLGSAVVDSMIDLFLLLDRAFPIRLGLTAYAYAIMKGFSWQQSAIISLIVMCLFVLSGL